MNVEQIWTSLKENKKSRELISGDTSLIKENIFSSTKVGTESFLNVWFWIADL